MNRREVTDVSLTVEQSSSRSRLGKALRVLSTPAVAILLALSAFAVADGAWLAKVPAKDHERQNPYHGQNEAVAAGRLLFLDHCAQCHGEDALGSKKRPPLRSVRVQDQASEGDLHWLLVNGNMKKGMPSWAKLPDQQLWQVITYVKSLGTSPAQPAGNPSR